MAYVGADGPKINVNGSCHCGNIKYTASIKTNSDGTLPVSRCNCTWCTKLGVTSSSLDGPQDFKLLSPTSRSELGDYTRTADGHRYFCKNCSVLVWTEGSYVYEGTKYDFFQLNLSTVDQPQEGVDLSKAKLSYWDGLHDGWNKGMGEKPFEGGLL